MKEMVGGCCVCSDERGWPENPLVYCDGQNCTVAVHQACYGIVTVPTGPWFCRKCESQERPARVRCELCPSRDGALKRTDNQGWAHVVCALYIPEVRFGNVTTMEPIILQLIPSERYAKTCYICQEIGKPNRANVGACMQCNKFNCKQQFHVTCAQSLGLLCEEAGNYLDNVKYCGYCQHHYSKLKKGGNVKTIPPYKPITHDSSGSDSGSSPEKEIDSTVSATASSTSATSIKITNAVGSSSASTSGIVGLSSAKQRKSSTASKQSNLLSSSGASSGAGSNVSATNNTVSGNSGPSSLVGASSTNETPSISGSAGISVNLNANTSKSNNNTGGSKEKEKHNKNLNKISSSKDKDKELLSSSTSSSSREKGNKTKNKDFGELGSGGTAMLAGNVGGTPGFGQNSTNVANRKEIGMETSSSSTDNTFTGSDSISNASSLTVSMKNSGGSVGKKRKADSKAGIFGDANDINHSFRDIIKDVSVTLTPLPLDKTSDQGEGEKLSKKQKTELSPPTHQSIESSFPNVSPKHLSLTRNNSLPATSTIQTQNVSPVESSITSSTTPSSSSVQHHKPAKERDERLRSLSPYTSTVSSVGGVSVSAGSATTTSAPSLYVSVPLSTANVPGLNLPTTTTADHPTPSQSTRAATQQQQSAVIERQSPRIHHQVTSSPAVSEHGSFSSSLPSPANAVLQQSGKSPSPSITVGSLTATTTESGNLKISYEKQNSRVAQLQEQESAPVRRSRTPDSGIFTSSFNISGSSQSSLSGATSSVNGGLKFSYEAQPGVASTATPPSIDTNLSNNAGFKDSPPSSPGSETGSARKRGRKSNEMKDVKLFQNGGCAVSTPVNTPTPASTSNGPIQATHMLGNQLNPTSNVAQKLTDQLHLEMQDHSVYTETQQPQFVGVPFPSKPVNNVRNPTSMPSSANSLASMFGGNGGGYAPQSLEQLLERQWEQGSQFLMEQAQHFDIASLLSCLHQLQTENVRLEEHVNSLIARRDHLLAVNARLAIPLNANVPQSQVNLNNIHLNGPTQPEVAATQATPAAPPSASVTPTSSSNLTTPNPTPSSRAPRSSASSSSQLPTLENGIDFRHSSHQQPSTVSAAVVTPTPTLAQSTSSNSLRHSSSVHQNFSTITPTSSTSHQSNHHHHQHQPHQHHHQQQQQPSLAQHSSMPSSASNVNSVMTSSTRQTQLQAPPPPHHHPPQTQHPHQQAHHPQHHSHHTQQQHQQQSQQQHPQMPQQQQQQQSLHSHHQHNQHQSHPLVQQHSHNHHHPSSTGPSAPHHMQQQPTSHHQMTMSNEGSMRTTAGGCNSGSGRVGNSNTSQMLPGRSGHSDNSNYHPVYSHQPLSRSLFSHN
ncbi:protein AF-10 isoform X2 [Eupeodes corollae]|uniref:protein AF-10 isoform X2 n=1 Tax=Eupeodes corollae TaxID=290404 RepID=UPI002490BA9F|nr:protein AF-10 isoform X2 [Eupeodes corollae]